MIFDQTVCHYLDGGVVCRHSDSAPQGADSVPSWPPYSPQLYGSPSGPLPGPLPLAGSIHLCRPTAFPNCVVQVSIRQPWPWQPFCSRYLRVRDSCRPKPANLSDHSDATKIKDGRNSRKQQTGKSERQKVRDHRALFNVQNHFDELSSMELLVVQLC